MVICRRRSEHCRIVAAGTGAAGAEDVAPTGSGSVRQWPYREECDPVRGRPANRVLFGQPGL